MATTTVSSTTQKASSKKPIAPRKRETAPSSDSTPQEESTAQTVDTSAQNGDSNEKESSEKKPSSISAKAYWNQGSPTNEERLKIREAEKAATGEAKTKLDNPANVRTRAWILTVSLKYNTIASVDQRLAKMADTMDDFTAGFSEEEGSSGYHHLQMFMYFLNKRRGDYVMNIFPGAHVEVGYSIAKSVNYFKKDSTHVSGPYVYGNTSLVKGMTDNVKIVKRDMTGAANVLIRDNGWRYDDFLHDDDWRKWAIKNKQGINDLVYSSIKDTFGKHSRFISVDYIYGGTGSYKTSSVFAMYGAENVFSVNLSTDRFQFDGYQGEPVILLDDYRNNFRYDYLLRVLNGSPFSVEVKGGRAIAQWIKVVITSNIPLEKQYPDLRKENRNALYRRFENGVVFLKKTPDDAIPYASKKDALRGIPYGGYPLGVPGFDAAAARDAYEYDYDTNITYTAYKRAFSPDELDGEAYWNRPMILASDAEKESSQIYLDILDKRGITVDKDNRISPQAAATLYYLVNLDNKNYPTSLIEAATWMYKNTAYTKTQMVEAKFTIHNPQSLDEDSIDISETNKLLRPLKKALAEVNAYTRFLNLN